VDAFAVEFADCDAAISYMSSSRPEPSNPNGITYHISGPADDEDYAQAEHLGEMLMLSLKGVQCVMHTILPEEWSDFSKQQCAQLGCKQRSPLVWLASGVVVGGLPEFKAEVEKKYGLSTNHVAYTVWPKVANENLAAARAAVLSRSPPPAGSSGSGAQRGADVAEALLIGNERYLGISDSSLPRAALGPSAVATVLALTPLPKAAAVLLDCDEAALFIVPCTPVGLEPLALGNVEHGVMSLGTRALLIVGTATAQLPRLVEAARAALVHKDAPLGRQDAAVYEGMAPALLRTLAVAPARSSSEELERLCLEEWVRESADGLLRSSAVLAEMHARGGLHIERLVCDEHGALTII